MRLGTVLEATWGSLTRRVRRPSVASLFRRADQHRTEGLYEEAARLLSQGLDIVPDSGVGHLLMAYLHADLRNTDLAREEFERVLALDPYHPRALLGLARIAIEEGDTPGSMQWLERALQYFPDFPEAAALRDMVASWPSAEPQMVGSAAFRPSTAVADGVAVRDLVLAHADGRLAFAQGDAERGQQLAQHASLISRMASTVLARAGLGTLRHGVVASATGTTVLLADQGRTFSVTLEGRPEIDVSLAEATRLRAALDVAP